MSRKICWNLLALFALVTPAFLHADDDATSASEKKQPAASKEIPTEPIGLFERLSEIWFRSISSPKMQPKPMSSFTAKRKSL